MRRQGHLWERFATFPALFAAARLTRRGKRSRADVNRFEFHLEPELVRLERELETGEYRPGNPSQFLIHEPKRRLISAAPYRDRVVQQALVSVLAPLWEPGFSPDSYACRSGKGTHAALDRCQQHARRHRYVWKADIRNYFPSIDHEILKSLIRRRVKDERLLKVVDLIIDSTPRQDSLVQWFPGDDLLTPAERRRGIPIGNQTSQFFANVYLDSLDHLLQDRLGVAGYVRYVDDLCVFGEDPRTLRQIRTEGITHLEKLRLRLHSRKDQVFPCRAGIRFLGFRLFSTHRLLVKENVWRFMRRCRYWQRQFAEGRATQAEIGARMRSWAAHAAHGDTFLLTRQLFDTVVFQRGVVE